MPDTECQTTWPGLDRAGISALHLAMSYLTSSSVTWYPEYGCALLALGAADTRDLGIQTRVADLALHLVCLDAWNYHIHRSVHCLVLVFSSPYPIAGDSLIQVLYIVRYNRSWVQPQEYAAS